MLPLLPAGCQIVAAYYVRQRLKSLPLGFLAIRVTQVMHYGTNLSILLVWVQNAEL